MKAVRVKPTEKKHVSSIYDVFSRETGSGTCSECNDVIQKPKGSTTAMYNHAEKLHNIYAPRKEKPNKNRFVPSETTTIEKLSKEFPLESMLARMSARDGISFHLFETSDDIRTGIKLSLKLIKCKEELKQSASSAKEAVMRFGNRVRAQLKATFQNILKSGEYLSVDFDEWSSMANRRYLNLSIFDRHDHHWNLGLVRITGKASADNLLNLVNGRLQAFGLDAKSNIVAFVTDGAKVMTCLHKHSMVEHQLCLAHGIQLAVIDVLYAKPTAAVETGIVESHGEDACDVETDTLNSEFDIEVSEKVIDFRSSTLRTVISKVRKIGAHFKRSAVDNEKLQDLVKSRLKIQKGKQLKLDSPTRWSSLYFMLDRFSELSKCIDIITKDMKGLDAKISADEKYLIDCVLRTLKPVKLTVEALCRRDSNLLKARAAFDILFRQLDRQDNPFSQKFASRLRERIQERWTINSGVLSYLDSGSLVDIIGNQNDSSSEDDDVDSDTENSRLYSKIFDNVVDGTVSTIYTKDVFEIPSRLQIHEHLLKLIGRMSAGDASLPTVLDSNNDTEPPPPKKKRSFEEKLNCAINSVDARKSIMVPQKSAIATIVEQEMEFLEKNKTRGQFLEKCYRMLSTIKPTSVESERAFSSAGALCTKIRTRYNDDTLDTLAFLRSHLKNPKSPSTVTATTATDNLILPSATNSNTTTTVTIE